MITYRTSESVCKGHPDKICDIIADKILDSAIRENPYCYNSIDVSIKDNTVFIYGETDTIVDYNSIVKDTLSDAGYMNDVEIIIRVSSKTSEDISERVKSKSQGIVFGYACNETKERMPLSIMLAHEIAKEVDDINSPYLSHNGKVQVTIAYENDLIKYIDTIAVSTSYDMRSSDDTEIRNSILDSICLVLARYDASKYFTGDTKILVNLKDNFILGESLKDKGATGRKIVVDTYGGHGKVGGGAFSSKDPSHMDRSAAYYARYVAKNILLAGYADKCEIQVSYSPREDHPISISIDCFGTNAIRMDSIYDYVNYHFNFSLEDIIEKLNLRNPIYEQTACYGHFGNPEYPWEQSILKIFN